MGGLPGWKFKIFKQFKQFRKFIIFWAWDAWEAWEASQAGSLKYLNNFENLEYSSRGRLGMPGGGLHAFLAVDLEKRKNFENKNT